MAAIGTAHPERFDPEMSANTLMESEHRGRYCWAAQAVTGQSVLDAGCGTGYGLAILAEAGASELTGVDIDPGAVAAAQDRAAERGATVAQGDLQALELPDDSFDVAVCFETIEHLASPEQGLAELRRVVRPDGILIVSSPNPDVYPSGNEHHLRELRPDELRQLVQSHFPTTRVYLQHPWLASVIEPAESVEPSETNGHPKNGVGVRRTNRLEPNRSTFAIAVGCGAEPPEFGAMISLGDDFEVKWWKDQVSEGKQRADAALAEATDSIERAAREAVAQAEARVAEQELGMARLLQEAAAKEAQASARLRQTSAALIDANQELAQAPVLKHRLAELYEENAQLRAQVDAVVGSRSWQLTGFLRKMSAALGLQR